MKGWNRDINLIAKRRQVWKQKLLIRFIIFVFSSIFVVILISFLLSKMLFINLQERNAKVQKKIYVLDDIDSIVKNIEIKESNVKSANAFIKEIGMKRIDALYVLDKISAVIPTNVGLTRISIDLKKVVSIGLLVDNPLEILSLYETLEKSGLFEPFEKMNTLPLINNEIEIDIKLTLKNI